MRSDNTWSYNSLNILKSYFFMSNYNIFINIILLFLWYGCLQACTIHHNIAHVLHISLKGRKVLEPGLVTEHPLYLLCVIIKFIDSNWSFFQYLFFVFFVFFNMVKNSLANICSLGYQISFLIESLNILNACCLYINVLYKNVTE